MNQQTNENNSTSCSYQELNPEMDAFLQGYLEEGRRKGLQESTIHLHDKIGHYFLFAMTETGCLKPQEMNAQNVGIACLKISSRWYLSHIRTFLRYAYQSGNTDRDYSGIVPLFKIPQPYPSVYTAEEIQKIENSVDQSSPHGKRDYAALLLATRLGIRSGDISSMTLECLDFERNLIRLTQHKTGVFIEFPMVSDVKVALERYLQEERTAYDSPYVFRHYFAIHSFAQAEKNGRSTDDSVPFLSVYLGHHDMDETEKYLKFNGDMFPEYMGLFEDYATGVFTEAAYEEK